MNLFDSIHRVLVHREDYKGNFLTKESIHADLFVVVLIEDKEDHNKFQKIRLEEIDLVVW